MSPDDPQQEWVRDTVLKIVNLLGGHEYTECCTVLTVAVASLIILADTGKEAESADGFARELKKFATDPNIGRWIRQFVTMN